MLSLFLASLLGAPSAEVGTMTAISPVTTTTAGAAVASSASVTDTAPQRAAVAAVTAAVAPADTATVPRSAHVLTDQHLRAARTPRGPPLLG